jgi:nicotinamide-nucleotide amidase
VPAVSDAALRRLATRVGARLRAAGETIVTAESCTGGFIAKCLTDLPGSSDYFDRGWITYSNVAKLTELGVEAGTLATHGAVSEAVALAMVSGALKRSKAHHSVAVTGIAGPAGGTARFGSSSRSGRASGDARGSGRPPGRPRTGWKVIPCRPATCT